MILNPKVFDRHRDRLAYIYVRQSSPHQVRHHIEGRERQYLLAQRAREFGWPEERIVILDEDLGLTGKTAEGREGFQRLVSEVSLGRAGILFALEVSRFARNNRDWYQVLDLCALLDTLIADEDGVYHPGDYNDRLLLGLKGTISEAELHALYLRMQQGKLHKARRGDLHGKLMAGYILDQDGRIQMHPDEAVRQAVHHLFEKFQEIDSSRQLVNWLEDQKLKLPRHSSRENPTAVTWVPPSPGLVHRILTNPIYAGTYAYGRRRIVHQVEDGVVRQKTERLIDPESWRVVIHDHHPAYISWDRFLQNQEKLRSNRRTPGSAQQVPGGGSALLQGVIRCGRCGRSMATNYFGKRRFPYYLCIRGREEGAQPCQRIGGRAIDKTVEKALLAAIEPAHIEAAIEALTSLQNSRDTTRRNWELQVERAAYEAARARRQYDAIEPENRLVARELERRWEEGLRELERVRAQAETWSRNQLEMTQAIRDKVRALSQDLPSLWKAETTTVKDRKRLLRCLIDQVLLTSTQDCPEVGIKIVWRTGEATEYTVERRFHGQHSRRTDEDTVELVRRLALSYPDAQIALTLNKQGRKTGQGNRFTASRVNGLRHNHNIPCFEPGVSPGGEVADGVTTFNLNQAARKLKVGIATVLRWLQEGWLHGRQATNFARWVIPITDEDVERLTALKASLGGALPRLDLEGAERTLGVSREKLLSMIRAGEIKAQRIQEGRRSRWVVVLPDYEQLQPGLFEESS